MGTERTDGTPAATATASYSDARTDPDSGCREERGRAKKERKRRERVDKRREDRERSRFGGCHLGLKFPQKKVSAGHSKNMRYAKDPTKKSAADMAAIFGVRAYTYPSDPPPTPLSRVNPKRRTTPTGVGDDGGTVSDQKRRRRDKNRDGNNGSESGAAKNK